MELFFDEVLDLEDFLEDVLLEEAELFSEVFLDVFLEVVFLEALELVLLPEEAAEEDLPLTVVLEALDEALDLLVVLDALSVLEALLSETAVVSGVLEPSAVFELF